MKFFRDVKFSIKVLALSLTLVSPVVGAQSVTDTQVKSVFLFNFLKFVELPSQNSAGPIRVCILGEQLLSQIRETMNGKAVHERNVQVDEIAADADVSSCSVVFFTSGTASPQLLKHLQGKGILSVGEQTNFIPQGGIINFFLEDEKVRFEVNPTRAESEGIKISSQLLRLAKIAN
jgi:hypothetical protein